MKDAAELASTSEDYKRLEYSLKVNMGVVCKFNDIKILQINSSKETLADRFPDLT